MNPSAQSLRVGDPKTLAKRNPEFRFSVRANRHTHSTCNRRPDWAKNFGSRVP